MRLEDDEITSNCDVWYLVEKQAKSKTNNEKF